MAYLIGAVITIAIIVVLFVLIWIGWRGRLRRQAHIPVPPEVPAELDGAGERIPVMYVATTLGEQRLERVAVHELGIRTEGALYLSEQGVIVERAGAPDFLIPAGSIAGSHADSGMAGKFVERDGLVVISWRLGDTPVDTGFRPRLAADRSRLLTDLSELYGRCEQ